MSSNNATRTYFRGNVVRDVEQRFSTFFRQFNRITPMSVVSYGILSKEIIIMSYYNSVALYLKAKHIQFKLEKNTRENHNYQPLPGCLTDMQYSVPSMVVKRGRYVSTSEIDKMQ